MLVCRRRESAVGGLQAFGLSGQVIDVPKISQDRIQQRLVDWDLHHSQMAEQLVEVPTVLSPSLLPQQRAEQIVDNPVPRGRRGGGGGLQGFLPVQNSTAPVAAPIVDIPLRSGGLQGFRPGQDSTASSSFPRSAHEACEGVFRTFFRIKKSAESGRQVSAEVGWHVSSSTLTAHQMARAGVTAHLTSSKPALQRPSMEAGKNVE